MKPAGTPAAAPRRRSLLMTGTGQRLGAALAIVAALWLAVAWALGMPA